VKLDYLRSAAFPVQASRSSTTHAQPPIPTVTLQKVHVASSPDGGEIYVDGKFYGNAPSDIRLALGEHTFWGNYAEEGMDPDCRGHCWRDNGAGQLDRR
jgi:PEGA domain